MYHSVINMSVKHFSIIIIVIAHSLGMRSDLIGLGYYETNTRKTRHLDRRCSRGIVD